jgi:hypothetical protein
MKVLFKIFFSSLGWYLLLTLPALFIPIMYFMSMYMAAAVCWIAGFLFFGFAFLLKQIETKHTYKIVVLYATAALCCLVAFQAVELFKLWDRIWESGGFLLFPIAAFVSACISIYQNRNELAVFFGKPTEIDLFLQTINNEA